MIFYENFKWRYYTLTECYITGMRRAGRGLLNYKIITIIKYAHLHTVTYNLGITYRLHPNSSATSKSKNQSPSIELIDVISVIDLSSDRAIFMVYEFT